MPKFLSFGSSAVFHSRPAAFRPTLAGGLALSGIYVISSKSYPKMGYLSRNLLLVRIFLESHCKIEQNSVVSAQRRVARLTFVAVGESGAILTSLDGVNWTPQDAGVPPYVYLFGVTFDGDLFVVTGGNGTVLTSADGVTWAHRASGTFYSLTGASFGNGTFVVVGEAGTICVAPF